ncbi:glutamate synthase [NADPH] large chain [Mesobacillus boroniphilus JCM 21738]|uniref:Glutamate synthase [NADPH] large chain n=1 Tax=Mesobacillus boroniphilus JCM 21738 TaxID=1294265 RepID=W4RRF7_9BACI|nr:glutamate synthase [NADPH] large chain [Mesobacillus boroniphilus JCM 21738]
MKTQWNPSQFRDFSRFEHDACGIVASIEKKKIPTRENIFHCINGLVTMNHRAGFINGEGDGVGVHIDIPRVLWKEKLTEAGADVSAADNENFVVGHVFITRSEQAKAIQDELEAKLTQQGMKLIFSSVDVTDSGALGPIAIQENPVFWQFACLANVTGQDLSSKLFNMIVDFEQNDQVHVASLSQYHAVYKVMGLETSCRSTIMTWQVQLLHPL